MDIGQDQMVWCKINKVKRQKSEKKENTMRRKWMERKEEMKKGIKERCKEVNGPDGVA
jgi:hypothetical protein